MTKKIHEIVSNKTEEREMMNVKTCANNFNAECFTKMYVMILMVGQYIESKETKN